MNEIEKIDGSWNEEQENVVVIFCGVPQNTLQFSDKTGLSYEIDSSRNIIEIKMNKVI